MNGVRMGEPAVVTGLGVIAPTGAGADEFWKATRNGACAIGPLRRYDPDGYPLTLAGEITDFFPEQAVGQQIAVQTDRFTQIAVAAADLALLDASFDPAAAPPFAVGVVTASGAGGVEFGQREIERLWRDGPRHVGPYQSIAWFYAASTGQISIRHGLTGPCGVLVTDEAGTLDAVAHARRDLRSGTGAMLVGGAEAPLAPFAMTCQYSLQLLSAGTDPATAYQPFTRRAAGFVPGEGGAVMLIEGAARAQARGARPYAEIAGYGTTFTGAGRFDRSAEGLVRAARSALADAGCGAEQVDVVIADAFGVPAADRAEAAALRELFGPRGVPVTTPKTGTGRAYAGAGAIDIATALLTIEQGVVPPTPNVDEVAYDIDLVTREARPAFVRTVLVWARGLSGMNSALVLRATG